MGKDEGMISMDDALYALVESGKITPQMAFTRSIEKERMKGRLGIRA
jgi:Tfp pilus assembly ATPase PilU